MLVGSERRCIRLNKRKAFQNAAILKKLKRKLRKSFFLAVEQACTSNVYLPLKPAASVQHVDANVISILLIQ